MMLRFCKQAVYVLLLLWVSDLVESIEVSKSLSETKSDAWATGASFGDNGPPAVICTSVVRESSDFIRAFAFIIGSRRRRHISPV